MQRCCRRAVVGTGAPHFMSRRNVSLLEHRTKGQPYMKHLDLYARRDVQLAPYLLREVDIEYKRKCRKVNFLVWMVICTLSLAIQIRVQGESLHYIRLYASFVRAEQDAKDEDNIKRRQAFVGIMNIVKDAFDRDQSWRKEDEEQALEKLS